MSYSDATIVSQFMRLLPLTLTGTIVEEDPKRFIYVMEIYLE